MSRSIWPFSHAASRQKDKATAALGIPTLDGLGADGKGAHAAYEQIYFSSLMPRTYLCARLLETLD
jgi:glutamate carboxypeptidase